MRLKCVFPMAIFMMSCTSEPELQRFQVSIFNGTSELLFIEAYYQGVLKEELNLETNDSGLDCSYSNEFFTGYKSNINIGCPIDSVVFKFNNNNIGYISSVNSESPYDFNESGALFGASEKFQKIADKYLFRVTQQDFENAFVLP